jgi:hypothetical protein
VGPLPERFDAAIRREVRVTPERDVRGAPDRRQPEPDSADWQSGRSERSLIHRPTA